MASAPGTPPARSTRWRSANPLMKTLYLDLISGISGDMFIGALVDLGVPATKLEHELAKLGVGGYHLHFTRGQKSSISGVKFDVHVSGPHDHHHGHQHAHAGESHEHSHSHSHGHTHSHHHEHDPAHEDEHEHHHQHEHDHEHEHEDHRTFTDIQALISRSGLSDWVKQKSTAIFRRVAEA